MENGGGGISFLISFPSFTLNHWSLLVLGRYKMTIFSDNYGRIIRQKTN